MSKYILSVVTVCPKSEDRSLAISALMYRDQNGSWNVTEFNGKYIDDNHVQDEMAEYFDDVTGSIIANEYSSRYELINHFFSWKTEVAGIDDSDKRALDASQNKTGNGQMVRYGGISELYEEAHHLGIQVGYDFYTVDLADERLLKGELPHYFCGRHGIQLNPKDFEGGACNPMLMAEEMALAYTALKHIRRK